nr:MAG TPA: hypothetical protein [Caudoviricetes sp.]
MIDENHHKVCVLLVDFKCIYIMCARYRDVSFQSQLFHC